MSGLPYNHGNVLMSVVRKYFLPLQLKVQNICSLILISTSIKIYFYTKISFVAKRYIDNYCIKIYGTRPKRENRLRLALNPIHHPFTHTSCTCTFTIRTHPSPFNLPSTIIPHPHEGNLQNTTQPSKFDNK